MGGKLRYMPPTSARRCETTLMKGRELWVAHTDGLGSLACGEGKRLSFSLSHLCLCLCFCDEVFLYSPFCPETHYADQDGIKLIEICLHSLQLWGGQKCSRVLGHSCRQVSAMLQKASDWAGEQCDRQCQWNLGGGKATA